ncbi:hypothetical protein MNBD_GAMMA06-1272 [hydrothermal vent metagenome]|uniref:histidine kinase n=1 Tax=hydrothermal vent metagenome TaxID=652676 RepID=A0A3B0WT50_9ZZZZ
MPNISQPQSFENTTLAARNQMANMDERIEAEQIRHIYSQTPIFVPMVIPGALLSILLLWSATTPFIAISWCAWIWMIYAGLWFLSRRWKKANVDDKSMRAWALPYIIMGWLATASWGLIGVLFFHADSFVYQSLLIIILVIGSAAITATSTAYSPTFYSVVLMVLPLMIRLLIENTFIYQLLAVGLFMFLIMLIFLHRNSHAFYASSLKQRFMNEELAEQLALQKDIAEQANISKSKFLAAASHDLRQPLYALRLFLDELRQTENEEKSRDLLMDHMDESINGMNDLFNGVLDVSRFEAGVVNTNLKHFCVDELFDSLREEYTIRAHAKGLRFRCLPCSATVISDPILLRRIVRNLLENAIRYTHAGGIVLGCRRKSGFICLQVCDTGIGIADENLQYIFDEFQQLDNPEGDSAKGIGLGLSVVKQLASVLNHELMVDSIPEKGAVFSLMIPLGYAQQVVTDATKDARVIIDNLDNACVLLINDVEDKLQASSSENLHELLLTWGSNVLPASNVETAQNIVKSPEYLPEIIILDCGLNCQQVDVELINKLRTEKSMNIPAVLIAENIAENHAETLGKNGVKFLIKPVNPVRFATLLRFLLN